ncbi:hypothetical protein [Indiicoccus explosivorum]|uniref:hypothetical protein n=1 Tax=Indiicoccus explosivorum TaxID=1917864 RepID=UPI0012D747E1|nr:hypothetical protein [Indiicoccus explosivorum]
MATKWKSDLWSIIAVVIGLFTLMYCFGSLFEIALDQRSAELLTLLQQRAGGGE